MRRFLHKLAEALRSREKYQEDYSAHSAFEPDEQGEAANIKKKPVLSGEKSEFATGEQEIKNWKQELS